MMQNNLLEKFRHFIKEKVLYSKKNRILMAVSGGVDSVVMAKLFKASGYHVGIAHVNFGLRGKESDGDQRFVANLARAMKAPFYTIRFDAGRTAHDRKISVQMAARELRYSWLEEIRAKNGFDFIAMAHHLQDITETMLVNLLRGTGISGLHGISVINRKVTRPLLFASKEEILDYAVEHKLKWREDSSNKTDDYTRNLLRNKVLPVFKKINPSYEKTMAENAARLLDAAFIVKEFIDTVEPVISSENEQMEYRLLKSYFMQHPASQTILYELIKKFDFTPPVVHDIVRSIGEIPGKRFFSPTHQLIIDREYLLVSRIKQETGEVIMEEKEDCMELIHDHFILKIFPLKMSGKLFRHIKENRDQNQFFADAGKIKLPVGIRTWRKGDYFYPLGMQGKKKLSDFYTDLKLSLTEKERTWLLCDDEKIIWVMGRRPDNRAAVSTNTKQCYRFEFTLK